MAHPSLSKQANVCVRTLVGSSAAYRLFSLKFILHGKDCTLDSSSDYAKEKHFDNHSLTIDIVAKIIVVKD